MNKELEALENIKHYDNRVELHQDDYNVLETALKDYELMKQTKIIVADKKINDDDLEKLKNQRMFVGNLEQCEIKTLFDEETQKKLKALEILKDCCLVNEGFGGYELAFAIKKNITKEEYDLLKEVLL